MPRRSISVLDLTAGQECARLERLRHSSSVVSPFLGGTICQHLGMWFKVRVTSPTKGRGRELFKERHVFRVRETND
jgi:hypothetical protein